jgi:acyl-CoA thioesterase-2
MAAGDLLSMLDLDRVDRDLYRAPVRTADERVHLFGGQVAAQAIRAAAHTVPEDRTCHSMHGYFLRRGLPNHDVILRVYRDRDGGSFSARRVVALQEGEVIFTVSTSFHVHEAGGVYQVEAPRDFSGPDQLAIRTGGGPPDFFEFKPVVDHEAGDHIWPISRMWVRTRDALPDDPIVHLCALTYMTDFGSGFAATEIEGLAPAGPSLDHCIWYHEPIRMDDWVLLDLGPLRASGGRGTYQGTVHDRQGTLGCVLAQEALLRRGPRTERADPEGSVP